MTYPRSVRSRAVVTGAGSGIGRAIAHELARRAGTVVCADIDDASACATADDIRRSGGRATAIACDVSSAEAVAALKREAEDWLGGPADLIVNNAGVGVGGRVGDVALEDWRWAIGVNLYGVIHGCHVFVPGLRELGRGGILNIASAAAFSAAPEMAPYNATKAAVVAISETLAAELAGTGIHVTVVCPTFVQTGIIERTRAPELRRRAAVRLMTRTGITAERVARCSLDALDRNRVYALPQVDARLVWAIKRLAPIAWTRALGWIYGRGLFDRAS